VDVQHNLPLDAVAAPSARAPRSAVRHQAEVLLAVGPAGIGSADAERLLERALADAGFATEAFRMVSAAEALQAGRWRRPSRAARLIIAFGVEAASVLLRRPVALGLERGRVRPMPDGRCLLVTEQPKTILGLSDAVARGREYRRLVNDLMLALPHTRLAA
jgi:hypothetical protein